MARHIITRLLATGLAFLPGITASASQPSIVPSEEAIRQNAFHIFNAIHSAMRQWGSSINHNGMSFFMATVPAGQPLYHGAHVAERREGFEWLAFEVEHAQFFARSWPARRGGHGRGPPRVPPLEQSESAIQHTDGRSQSILNGDANVLDNKQTKLKLGHLPEQTEPIRGYLHTYRAARPLNLLYIDGMSAGMLYGVLDTQDYILLNWSLDTDPPFSGEFARARDLCQLAEDWAWQGGRIDGFIRTEAGYEIIYCEFAAGGGLDLVSIGGSSLENDPALTFEWLRAVSLRYHGFPRGRVEMDWSSMVSAYFFDMNLTNPDITRPELPRVVNATTEERSAVKKKVRDVISRRHGKTSVIEWQGIVDMIVTRYSNRLAGLAIVSSTSAAKGTVNTLLAPYIDFTQVDPLAPAVNRCTRLPLEAASLMESLWTPEDKYVYLAIEAVSHTICSALMELRKLLNDGGIEKDEVDAGDSGSTIREVHRIVSELMLKLNWTTWKDCGKCPSADEICFVAMFPVGSSEDHFSPRCKNISQISKGWDYWFRQRRRTSTHLTSY